MDYFACKLFFCAKLYLIKCFIPTINILLIDYLKVLLRGCERLLHHSKDPVPLESISRKSERIESYLRHTLEIYENSLNRKRKNMAQTKLLRPRSWPECNVFPASPAIYVTDNGTQTVNITWSEVLKHDHEEENNRWVMNELKVFRQHLLDYNKTSGNFFRCKLS